MNILIDELPVSVTVDGKSYKIAHDFRTCVRVILAFEDKELTDQEKIVVLLSNLYYKLPANIEGAVKEGMRFLDGPLSKGKEDDEEVSGLRVYSFAKDAGLIYAAFKKSHNVNLSADEMHWWQFISLFMDVGTDTVFSYLVSLRKRVKTGKASKDDLRVANELGDVFELEDIDTRTPEDKLAEDTFMSLLNKGAQS